MALENRLQSSYSNYSAAPALAYPGDAKRAGGLFLSHAEAIAVVSPSGRARQAADRFGAPRVEMSEARPGVG